jgi:exonuclease SbcC
LDDALQGQSLTAEQWSIWQETLNVARDERDNTMKAVAVAESSYQEVQQRHTRWMDLAKKEAVYTDRHGRLQDLNTLFRGHAFVDFLSGQQLQQVAWEASAHLGMLTRFRYALEVASDGSFIIRDDASGGYKRAVHTLSGGETFLTSLALALALSAQIQLRGRYPLQFFFLDEGFGSLDQELLDVAMTALERLHLASLHVGVISHVPEMRNRILRRLIVEPAQPGERGSRILADA